MTTRRGRGIGAATLTLTLALLASCNRATEDDAGEGSGAARTVNPEVARQWKSYPGLVAYTLLADGSRETSGTCGGAVISTNPVMILTAAHCMVSLNGRGDWSVATSAILLYTPTGTPLYIPLTKADVFLHPAYGALIAWNRGSSGPGHYSKAALKFHAHALFEETDQSDLAVIRLPDSYKSFDFCCGKPTLKSTLLSSATVPGFGGAIVPPRGRSASEVRPGVPGSRAAREANFDAIQNAFRAPTSAPDAVLIAAPSVMTFDVATSMLANAGHVEMRDTDPTNIDSAQFFPIAASRPGNAAGLFLSFASRAEMPGVGFSGTPIYANGTIIGIVSGGAPASGPIAATYRKITTGDAEEKDEANLVELARSELAAWIGARIKGGVPEIEMLELFGPTFPPRRRFLLEQNDTQMAIDFDDVDPALLLDGARLYDGNPKAADGHRYPTCKWISCVKQSNDNPAACARDALSPTDTCILQ